MVTFDFGAIWYNIERRKSGEFYAKKFRQVGSTVSWSSHIRVYALSLK